MRGYSDYLERGDEDLPWDWQVIEYCNNHHQFILGWMIWIVGGAKNSQLSPTRISMQFVNHQVGEEALLSSIKLIVGDHISDPIRLSGPAKGELVSGFSPVSGRLSSIDMYTHQLWLGACHHEYIGVDREGWLTTSRVMLILHSLPSNILTQPILLLSTQFWLCENAKSNSVY